MKKKIAIIVAIFFVLGVGIAGTALLILNGINKTEESRIEPMEVYISNLQDTSLTVNWGTVEPTISKVIIIDGLSTKTFFQSKTDKTYTHAVDVNGLEPGKKYNFAIDINDKVYTSSPESEAEYVLQTANITESQYTPLPIYGRVLVEENYADSDILVYVTLKNEAKEESTLLSTVSNSQGFWIVDPANARLREDPDKLVGSDFEISNIIAYSPVYGSTTFSPSNSYLRPVETFTIGQGNIQSKYLESSFETVASNVLGEETDEQAIARLSFEPISTEPAEKSPSTFDTNDDAMNPFEEQPEPVTTQPAEETDNDDKTPDAEGSDNVGNPTTNDKDPVMKTKPKTPQTYPFSCDCEGSTWFCAPGECEKKPEVVAPTTNLVTDTKTETVTSPEPVQEENLLNKDDPDWHTNDENVAICHEHAKKISQNDNTYYYYYGDAGHYDPSQCKYKEKKDDQYKAVIYKEKELTPEATINNTPKENYDLCYKQAIKASGNEYTYYWYYQDGGKYNPSKCAYKDDSGTYVKAEVEGVETEPVKPELLEERRTLEQNKDQCEIQAKDAANSNSTLYRYFGSAGPYDESQCKYKEHPEDIYKDALNTDGKVTPIAPEAEAISTRTAQENYDECGRRYAEMKKVVGDNVLSGYWYEPDPNDASKDAGEYVENACSLVVNGVHIPEPSVQDNVQLMTANETDTLIGVCNPLLNYPGYDCINGNLVSNIPMSQTLSDQLSCQITKQTVNKICKDKSGENLTPCANPEALGNIECSIGRIEYYGIQGSVNKLPEGALAVRTGNVTDAMRTNDAYVRAMLSPNIAGAEGPFQTTACTIASNSEECCRFKLGNGASQESINACRSEKPDYYNQQTQDLIAQNPKCTNADGSLNMNAVLGGDFECHTHASVVVLHQKTGFNKITNMDADTYKKNCSDQAWENLSDDCKEYNYILAGLYYGGNPNDPSTIASKYKEQTKQLAEAFARATSEYEKTNEQIALTPPQTNDASAEDNSNVLGSTIGDSVFLSMPRLADDQIAGVNQMPKISFGIAGKNSGYDKVRSVKFQDKFKKCVEEGQGKTIKECVVKTIQTAGILKKDEFVSGVISAEEIALNKEARRQTTTLTDERGSILVKALPGKKVNLKIDRCEYINDIDLLASANIDIPCRMVQDKALGNNSKAPSRNIISKVSAEDTESVDIDIDEIFTELQQIELAERRILAGRDKTVISIFNDKNGDGVKQDDEPYLNMAGVAVELSDISEEAEIKLNEGWNLVSFPLYSESLMNASTLIKQIAEQGGYVTTIATYENGRWIAYKVRGNKVYANGDIEIQPGIGYFLFSTSNFTFKYGGERATTSEELSLIKGWNLLGFSPGQSQSGLVWENKYKSEYPTGKEILKLMNSTALTVDTLATFNSGRFETIVGKETEDSTLYYGEDMKISDVKGYFLRSSKKFSFTP